MKQEAPYILEWVAYHKALGFELIIADNGGNDDTSKILTALHKARICTRIDFRFKKTSPQIPAYRAIIRLAKIKKIDIIGFLDCDEFFARYLPVCKLTPKNGAEYIASEFARLQATQISYHWLIFGSQVNNPDITAPVLERFSHHSKIDENKKFIFENKSFVCVKELFKWSNVFLLGPKILTPHLFHDARSNWYFDDEKVVSFDCKDQKTSYNNGTVLHYQLKTWAEFQNKKSRGRGDSGNSRYDVAFFNKNDVNDINTEIDPEILIDLKTRIALLKNKIGEFQNVETNNGRFNKLWIRILSMGLSDLENHKMIFFIYKRIKKLRSFEK